jgi:hypothetical protein
VRTTVQDPALILLSKSDTVSARNNANGHLFETFMAQVMHLYGYGSPTTKKLNVTAEGSEVDIELTHELDKHKAIAECKAYSSPVNVDKLSSFYGELSAGRLDHPDLQGYFIATPRLTPNAQEKADSISRRDTRFRVVDASTIWDLLLSRNEIQPAIVPIGLSSDPAIVVHSSGIYCAALEIDANTKTGARVLVSAISGSVHPEALELLAEHKYAQQLPVVDCHEKAAVVAPRAAVAAPVIVEVVGSKSDFEYQLPAAPKYFVGRAAVLKKLSDLLANRPGPFVLNAQSGWGKSSLALKVATGVSGIGIVVDSRTATSGNFIPSALHKAFLKAELAGILKMPSNATWATLPGSFASIQGVEWLGTDTARVVVVFDQFENIFREEELTREFRDLALWNSEHSGQLSIGFAWKTDFVDWTESHPYQLRDQIRGCSAVFYLEPFGSREVDTILKRLEKQLDIKLSREIRQRLREYSQGLPWLLKKLAGHLIREISAGKTQEQLVAEALNIQNLFESDLAALSPSERDALAFVARFAPVRAQEVTERHPAGLIQSLLDQRLLVQVGEKLDTYWDIFRDFVVSGRVPIEDSYIIRQTPGSVGRLIAEVLQRGGDAGVAEISSAWQTTENVVWNGGRELRQLGLAASVPNRIQLIPELAQAEDIELELRRRIARALRRHRAFTVFGDVCERSQGIAQISDYASHLREVFPAVEGTSNTWNIYARSFVSWFAYAGLAISVGTSAAKVAPEGTGGRGNLLGGGMRRLHRTVFPSSPAGPVIAWLVREFGADELSTSRPTTPTDRAAAAQAIALGAVHVGGDDELHVVAGLIGEDGANPVRLRALLEAVPGGREALGSLERDPKSSPIVIGRLIAEANEVNWAAGTQLAAGKALRGWARAAGAKTRRPGRLAEKVPEESLPGLE